MVFKQTVLEQTTNVLVEKERIYLLKPDHTSNNVSNCLKIIFQAKTNLCIQ